MLNLFSHYVTIIVGLDLRIVLNVVRFGSCFAAVFHYEAVQSHFCFRTSGSTSYIIKDSRIIRA